jgi:hypothetical protein
VLLPVKTKPLEKGLSEKERHRVFFEHLAAEYEIRTSDQWYRVTREDVYSKGGENLLRKRYNNSVFEALNKLFPNLNLLPWKFDQLPLGLWNDINKQR